MTRYLKMKNSKEAICCVDTSAVVAGKLHPAIVDTAKDGVAATDAGTDRNSEGKSRGDADPVEASKKVLHTIFALGGAGLTITVISSKNIAIVVK